jgi:LuxR family maltose regulon positive regulatory protein
MLTKSTHDLIVDSKLQVPRIKTKVLQRRRLLRLLDGHRDRKLILLCAPAGYGKTTLLIQFLARIRLPYLYYQLEKSDAEPAVFLSYLIAGLRKSKPGFGTKTLSLAHLYNYPQRYFEIIAGTLVNEINAAFPGGLYLVLEDYHSLGRAPAIDRLIDYLLNHLTPAIHLLITTRYEPRLALALLKGRDEVFEMTADLLRFDRREISDLFEKTTADPLPEAEVTRIEKHSEGWPVALRFMVQDLERGVGFGLSSNLWQDQTRPDLARYFTQEIYDREPPAIQEFLRCCAIPDWFSPALCRRIAGRPDAAELLSGLAQRNLFLFPISETGYRYHHLFREFLLGKVNERREEVEFSRRVADYYRVNDQPEEALRYHLRAGDHATAAELIEAIGDRLIGQGKSAVLQAYLQQLPAPLIRSNSRLLLYQSQVDLFQGRGEEAKAACAAAIKLLKPGPARSVVLADARYKLAGLFLNEGNFTTARKLYQAALAACPVGSREARAAILNSYASLLSATGGRHARPVDGYFKAAHRLARQTGNRALEASILNNWARNEWDSGKVIAAYTKFTRMARLLKDHFTPGCGGGFYNAARLSLILGDRDETRSILDQGRTTCAAYNDQWSLARIDHGYALLYREIGDLPKARDYARQVLDAYQKIGVPGLTAMAHAELARIALAQGHLDEAEKNLTAAWSIKGSAADADTLSLYRLAAEIQIGRGRLREAEKVINKWDRETRKYGKVQDFINIYLRRAEISFRLGRETQTARFLGKATALCRRRGFGYILVQAEKKEPWITEFLKNRLEATGAKGILKSYHPLRIRSIEARFVGVPRLYWGGKPIAERAWKTVKSKKIMFFVMWRNPEKIPTDQLIESFWPGAGLTAGQTSLRKAIQHIREAFAAVGAPGDIVVAEKGFIGIAPNIIVQRDLDRYKNLIAATRKSKKRGREWRGDLARTWELCAPGIANGWFDDWVEDIRAVFKKTCEPGIKMLADNYAERKKYEAAAAWYRKLIDLNPYEENYYRALMEILAKGRRTREIKLIYHRLTARLRKELEAEPQPATAKSFKELVPEK